MRLAISNLAWPREQDEQVAALLRRLGVRGVELAPTKVWPRPLEASAAEVAACRAFWESRGVEVVALQALLFGRPDLTVFGTAAKRRETLDYLAGMIGLAARLGAKVLVFGSPANRKVGAMPPAEARPLALAFFRGLGAAARAHGVAFCVEPNPPAYGCDYITRPDEAADLVREVGDAGFGLHLDAGGMSLTGDAVADVLAKHAHLVRHFHVSEPHLGPVGAGATDHAAAGAALRSHGYGGWASIEMKPVEDRPLLEALGDALRFAQKCYG